MFNGTQGQNPLVPLILRLVLGAIFIYHGGLKVMEGPNDWGASWAREFWDRQSKPPKDFLDKLDQVASKDKEDQERMKVHKETKEKLKVLWGKEVPPPPAGLEYSATQLAVAWGELWAGIALVIGLLTRVAALAMIIIQIGAIATVTWGKGFSFAEGGGFEYNLALLAMCLALVFTGGGALSADGCLRRRPKRPHAATPAGTA
jgi:uncharacterized membrane protein YphA (DoxX/SURF4 family)